MLTLCLRSDVMSDSRRQAFWTFNALLRGPLAAIFGPEGPNVEVFLMDEMLQERIPALCQHLIKVGIPLRTYTTQWMVCAFTTALPPETTLRVQQLRHHISPCLSAMPPHTHGAVRMPCLATMLVGC